MLLDCPLVTSLLYCKDFLTLPASKAFLIVNASVNALRGARRRIYLPMSIEHGIDLGSKEALRRGVMHLLNTDFALEWPRALPPNVKLVGPLMPEPAKPLPPDLQACTHGSAFHSSCL